MSQAQLIMTNQFGEESINTLSAAAIQALATEMPAKAEITAISALATPVAAITIALATSGGNTYSDAAVNTAINAALVTVVADLQAHVAQLNLILAALKQTT